MNMKSVQLENMTYVLQNGWSVQMVLLPFTKLKALLHNEQSCVSKNLNWLIPGIQMERKLISTTNLLSVSQKVLEMYFLKLTPRHCIILQQSFLAPQYAWSSIAMYVQSPSSHRVCNRWSKPRDRDRDRDRDCPQPLVHIAGSCYCLHLTVMVTPLP
jgi:hypothetical protein